VQIVSARIGSVTGRGLAANLQETLPPSFTASRLLAIFGWLATLLMGVVVAAFFLTSAMG
jgi:Mn2+/Fe2+ NRAMP family transporter